MRPRRRGARRGPERPAAQAATSSARPAIVARKALPMRAFADSLPMRLLRAREAVMRRFRPALRDHGVTEQQWRVLRALAGHESLEITELAGATCLLAPSLSRILPDLEARGLIERQPVRSDLRRSRARLTPEGLRLIAAHAPHAERIYGTIEQRFGAERLDQLVRLLSELEVAVGGPTRHQAEQAQGE